MQLQPGDMLITGSGDLDRQLKMLSYVIWQSVSGPNSRWTHEFAAALVRPCPGKDAHCELKILFDAMKSHLRYTYHPRGTDRYQTAQRTWELGVSDCDQDSSFVCAVAHVLGFDVGVRVYSNDGTAWDHIAPFVGLPREVGRGRSKKFILELTDGPLGTPESAQFGWQVPLNRVAGYEDRWIELG